MVSMLGAAQHRVMNSGVVTTTYPESRQYRTSDNADLGLWSAAGSFTHTASIKDIIYTTKPKTQRGMANMCINTKTFDRPGGSTGEVIIQWPSHGSYVRYNQMDKDAHDLHPVIVGLADAAFGSNIGTAYLGANAQGFMNDAAWRLKPDLTTVSIPNDLLDWSQIPDLIKVWKSNLSIVKNVAGAHLNYKFGWKPTIGDLKDAIDGVRNLQRKLDDFRERCGTIIDDGYTNLRTTTTSKSGTYVPSATQSVAWTASLTQHVRSYVRYMPMYPYTLGITDTFIRGMLDTLGFELNPRIIWDKIPFTFIIDWFIGIGAWLERFKLDTFELPIKYVDSYIQYKESRKYRSRYSIVSGGGFIMNSTAQPWETQVDFFQRMPLLPDYYTLSSLNWKPLNVNHFLLLVSLGVVNLG